MILKNKIKTVTIVLITVLIFAGVVICIVINNNKQDTSHDKNLLSVDYTEKLLLAGVLSEGNPLVTEDNNNHIEEFISKLKLGNGIYVTPESKEKFSEIIYNAIGIDSSFDSEGYLNIIENNKENNNDIIEKINNSIKSQKTTIVNINSTYKGMIGDEIVDFRIENENYVETFDYNENIVISIINSKKITNNKEGLTDKELAEEILINLFN